MAFFIRRRELIAALGSAVAAWPLPLDPAARHRGDRISLRYVGLWH
jgi:hypothetical protein